MHMQCVWPQSKCQCQSMLNSFDILTNTNHTISVASSLNRKGVSTFHRTALIFLQYVCKINISVQFNSLHANYYLLIFSSFVQFWISTWISSHPKWLIKPYTEKIDNLSWKAELSQFITVNSICLFSSLHYYLDFDPAYFWAWTDFQVLDDYN